MPVKNGMPFLPQTLESIEAQTDGGAQMVAWDNGSTDGTLEELRRWIPARIPGYVVAGRGLSLAQSLAAMVREAETELCARIDADDVNHPDRLAKQRAYLTARPDVAVVGTWASRLDPDGLDHGLHLSPPTDHNDIVDTMLNNNALAHPTVMFRRSAVLRAGNYRDVPSSEDYDLWLRLAAKQKLGNIPEILVGYRVRSDSATQQQLSSGVLLAAINAHFATNAPSLYGCSRRNALALRERRLRNAWPVIRRVGKHLAKRAKMSIEDYLCRPTFLDNMQFLLTEDDLNARLEIAYRRADPLILEHEWLHKPELTKWQEHIYRHFEVLVKRRLDERLGAPYRKEPPQ